METIHAYTIRSVNTVLRLPCFSVVAVHSRTVMVRNCPIAGCCNLSYGFLLRCPLEFPGDFHAYFMDEDVLVCFKERWILHLVIVIALAACPDFLVIVDVIREVTMRVCMIICIVSEAFSLLVVFKSIVRTYSREGFEGRKQGDNLYDTD